MNKTLRISFSLKNTYRVNGILFFLKQIPFLKKIFPEMVYQVKGFKIFANLLSVLWEIVSTFLWKFLYFLIMVGGMGFLYNKGLPKSMTFLHILLFLTMIGSLMNTRLFNPTKDKYYAMILIRMDAKEYTLVNYFYALLKIVIGFLPFTIFFGIGKGIPLWLCLLLPFCIAGMKLLVTALILSEYEKKGYDYNENKFFKNAMIGATLLVAFAYGLPMMGIALPEVISIWLFLICLPLGMIGLIKVFTFQDYRAVNQELLSKMVTQMDSKAMAKLIKKENEKKISADTSIHSHRIGFEYLNELFIKRHKKILWDSTKKVSYGCILFIFAILMVIFLRPDLKPTMYRVIMTNFSSLVLVMYSINRGARFTQVLFMNCDHSLLTYSFYKQPKLVLRLFQIRLREIMKINAVPALIIGIGLSLILYVIKGKSDFLNDAIMIVSILCISLFFSIHYLTIYYLLQPYNAETELKSGIYQLVMLLTYLVSFHVRVFRLSFLMFGLMTIVFCVLYSMMASFLVYRFAPKTFKIRK